MSDLSSLKFFTTRTHSCSYLDEQNATTLFLDPDTLPDQSLHSTLSHYGFRRSGHYLYRPHCEHCHACLSARVNVRQFQLNRRARRIIKRNRSVTVGWESPSSNREFYQLYARYIESRHRDGDMYPPNPEQFANFLMSEWSNTKFLCFRQQQKLLAVAVTDQLNDGFSAVYCFFDPDYHRQSLGTYAILQQIEICRQLQLPWLYLGYLIRDCQKMTYKTAFQPLEIYNGRTWIKDTP